MAHFPSTGVFPIDVPLRPEELVAAWRVDSRRLVLTAPGPLPARQRVAARISLIGRGVAATITGRVEGEGRKGSVDRIELAPDDIRMRALERLLAVARGEAVNYQARIPRHLATIPAVVNGPAGPTYMNTFSVSANGCGLAWSSPVPAVVGAEMDIRLGTGSRTVTLRSVVCWTAKSGGTSTVGVRFAAGARGAWPMLLTEALGSGAPPA